jgi:uncharacterized protein YciI
MKHFIIESTFTVPFEQLGETLPEHRRFLQKGYETNRLLCSGPQSTRKGGVIVARASSLEDIQGFFADDPYQKKGLAIYRFIEFSPVLHQKLIESWIAASA